jgi:hypothetical protein
LKPGLRATVGGDAQFSSFKLAQSSLKKGCGSGVLDPGAGGFALLLNVPVISETSIPSDVLPVGFLIWGLGGRELARACTSE